MSKLNAALRSVYKELNALDTGRRMKKCNVDYFERIVQVGNYYIYRTWVSDDRKIREDAEITLNSPQRGARFPSF